MGNKRIGPTLISFRARFGAASLLSLILTLSRRSYETSWKKLRLRVLPALLAAFSISITQLPVGVLAQGNEWVPGESPFQRQTVNYTDTQTSAGTIRSYDLQNAEYEELEVGGWDGGEGKSMLGFELNIGPDNQHAPFISSDYYQVLPVGGPTAIYELANQPSYDVSLGPVMLNFKGARVRLTEGLPSDSSCAPMAQAVNAYSGWASEVIQRADESVDQRLTLAKGYLTQHVVMVGTAGFVTCQQGEPQQQYCNANYVYRFSYHPPGGGRAIDFYQKPVEQGALSRYNGSNQFNVCESIEIGSLPARYWSTDGSAWLDMRDEMKPVIIFSDGSMEELPPAIPTDLPGPGAMGCIAAPPKLSPGGNPSGPLRKIDRNGSFSTYTISGNQLTETVTDELGRQVTLTFSNGSAFKRLTSVRIPAPAGNTTGFLQYTVNWQTLNINMATVFPDITCPALGSCGSSTIDVVSSIQIPDGRSYFFQYGPFGNLTQVTEPGGAVRTYSYGTQTNNTYATNSVPLTTRPLRTEDGTANGCAIWTGQGVNLQKRGVISQTLFPQGQGGGNPAHITTTAYERVVLPGASVDVTGASTTVVSNSQVVCDSQVWRVVTMPDGSVHKQGYCANALRVVPRFSSGLMSSHEWELGTEVWSPGQAALISASYKGNKDTGALFYAHDTITAVHAVSPPAVDRRVTRVVTFKNGVVGATTFSYGDIIDIDHTSSGFQLRNTNNITSQSIWSCSDLTSCLNGQFGTKLLQTDTSYFHPPPYFDPSERNPSAASRNILRLPQTVTLTDPQRGVLTRTDYRYDEFSLTASAAPNLITDPAIIGTARGNPTTTISYKQPASGSGPIPTEVRYFDTGDVRQTFDPLRRNPTTMTYDFGVCSSSHTRLTSTVTNVKGFVTTTVSDCFTGAVLRVTDPNNQSSFTQYDNLGRPVETAGPGDTLTSISGFTRDPAAPISGGTVAGNNGQGPTTWTEYLSLGVVNQQRTVVHTKDGSADGLYVKTFVDGFGRTIQTRKEVDPATSGGSAEVVFTTVYDSMGRVSQNYVPCFSVAGNSVSSPCTTLSTVTTFDVLGRTTSVRPPGLPASTISYGPAGSLLLTTLTDAKGNQTQTLTDLLGRTVQVARQSNTCSDPVLGNWCVTIMEYDAAGRLLQTTDPGNHRMIFVFDGLGRKTSMTDPDMGVWTYSYDDNGNLIQQIDAKGQIIQLTYDVLNRISRRDLPPNSSGAGPEDTTYFYDGDQPN